MIDMPTVVADNLGLIRSYANRLTSNWETANEVVQEACVLILASKTYDPADPQRCGPGWFYWKVRTAKQRLWKRATVGLQGDTPIVVAPNQEHAADVALIAANDNLSDKQRDLMGHMLAGDRLFEAAEDMGISRQAAHQMLGRVRKVLKLAA